MKSYILLLLFWFGLTFPNYGQLYIAPSIGIQAPIIKNPLKQRTLAEEIDPFYTYYVDLGLRLSPDFSIVMQNRFTADYYSAILLEIGNKQQEYFDIQNLNWGTGLALQYWATDDWEFQLGYSFDRLKSIDVLEFSANPEPIRLYGYSKNIHVAEVVINYYVYRKLKIGAKLRYRPILSPPTEPQVLDEIFSYYLVGEFFTSYIIDIKSPRLKFKKRMPRKSKQIGCPE